MSLEDDSRRGVDANQVLQSRLYQEAFQIVEQRLITELATIEIKPERAEYLRQLLVMGRKYRAYLEQVMLTGKMADEQLSLMDKLKGKRALI